MVDVDQTIGPSRRRNNNVLEKERERERFVLLLPLSIDDMRMYWMEVDLFLYVYRQERYCCLLLMIRKKKRVGNETEWSDSTRRRSVLMRREEEIIRDVVNLEIKEIKRDFHRIGTKIIRISINKKTNKSIRRRARTTRWLWKKFRCRRIDKNIWNVMKAKIFFEKTSIILWMKITRTKIFIRHVLMIRWFGYSI